MRPKPDKLQGIGLLHSVNQNQVGLDVAVAMILPVTNQAMIPVARI